MSSHDATFYVQIAADFYTSTYREPTTSVRSIKAVEMTQNRPRKPKPGTVTVKLTVRVPDGALLPLAPQVVVVIPEDMVMANEVVTVEAEDANP